MKIIKKMVASNKSVTLDNVIKIAEALGYELKLEKKK